MYVNFSTRLASEISFLKKNNWKRNENIGLEFTGEVCVNSVTGNDSFRLEKQQPSLCLLVRKNRMLRSSQTTICRLKIPFRFQNCFFPWVLHICSRRLLFSPFSCWTWFYLIETKRFTAQTKYTVGKGGFEELQLLNPTFPVLHPKTNKTYLKNWNILIFLHISTFGTHLQNRGKLEN